MPPKEKYTDPELRDEIKKEVHNSDKGGKPGQWSARKVSNTITLPLRIVSNTHAGTNDGIGI